MKSQLQRTSGDDPSIEERASEPVAQASTDSVAETSDKSIYSEQDLPQAQPSRPQSNQTLCYFASPEGLAMLEKQVWANRSERIHLPLFFFFFWNRKKNKQIDTINATSIPLLLHRCFCKSKDSSTEVVAIHKGPLPKPSSSLTPMSALCLSSTSARPMWTRPLGQAPGLCKSATMTIRAMRIAATLRRARSARFLFIHPLSPLSIWRSERPPRSVSRCTTPRRSI